VIWQKLTGIKIYDADGWRDGKSFNAPITEKEWLRRMSASTCVHPCGMFHGIAKMSNESSSPTGGDKC